MSQPDAFHFFDRSHWDVVRAERARLGMAPDPERDRSLPDHHLQGQTVEDQTTGKVYLVESVKTDWLQGRFTTALLNHEGSHRVVVVDASEFADIMIRYQAAHFKASFVRLASNKEVLQSLDEEEVGLTN